MPSYSFTLILFGMREISVEVENALYEAGCDDGTLGLRAGVPYLDFERASRSYEAAVASAIRDVGKAGYAVVRVEPDDWVTASEIARRSGRTRESIRLLVSGKRGPGDFPAPSAGLTGHSPLWSWAAVSAWMLKHKLADNDELRRAAYIRQLNRKLDRPLAHSL